MAPGFALGTLVELRWPAGVVCPACGSRNVSFSASRQMWQCKEQHSKRLFSVKTGTVFEDSHVGLDKWFVATWLIANSRNGASSVEIRDAAGVTQKTACLILHRIRLAMQVDSFIHGGTDGEAGFAGPSAVIVPKVGRAELLRPDCGRVPVPQPPGKPDKKRTGKAMPQPARDPNDFFRKLLNGLARVPVEEIRKLERGHRKSRPANRL